MNLPEATARAMRGDWFVTGDLARMDDEGYIYIVDRKNDMIITGCEKVYPREVESACRTLLARYKVPKEFRMVDAVPRNSMGKIMRRALRDDLAK